MYKIYVTLCLELWNEKSLINIIYKQKNKIL